MLAWRAGLLPPEAAADIERQIHRGKAATFLLAQVDAFSTRPPRVAMTWLAKGGVTESDVTDYLRNRLREDRLVAFEKACLESENLLAHVVWRHRQLVEARRDSSRQIPPSLDGQPISLRPSDRDDRAAAFEKSLLDSLDVIATAQRDGTPPPLPDARKGHSSEFRQDSEPEPNVFEPGDLVGAEIGTAIEMYLLRRRMDWWWSTAARVVVVVGAFFILTGATFGDWLSIVFAIVVFSLLGLGLYLHSLTTELPKDLEMLVQFFRDVERVLSRVGRRPRQW
jgi:hypothetical protein